MSKRLLIAAVATIGSAGLLVGGWQAGWWLRAEATDRRVKIDNIQKGTQIAWRNEAVRSIAQYHLLDVDNQAARAAVRIQACGLIASLTDTYRTPELTRFNDEECS